MDLESLRRLNLETVRAAYTSAGLPAQPAGRPELENYRRAAELVLRDMTGLVAEAQRDRLARSALAAPLGEAMIFLDRLAMHSDLSLADAIDAALSHALEMDPQQGLDRDG